MHEFPSLCPAHLLVDQNTSNSSGCPSRSGETSGASANSNGFSKEMYALLERNMLTKMHYRINSLTELDFLLFFSHYIFEETEAKELV